METNLPYYFDLLKKYVLSKAGIATLSPGDCKKITLDIRKSTGKYVSETTLKRFFGFASKKYNFSKFTINSLCEYVGYNGWEAFQQALDGNANGEIIIQSTNWRQLRRRAEVISDITLKTIQNRSGIPYAMTIPRQFAETDFTYFIESPYKLTTYIAPPGWGKSILLAHMVETFFLEPDAPYGNSIVWFVNAGILNSLGSYGFHLDDWFNEQLGLVGETTFREYFRQHPEEVNGKIFLVLDGFDEYMFTNEQLNKLFNNITDLVCYSDDVDWLKVVVSMRSDTWLRLEEKITGSDYLRKYWYPGVFFRKERHTNVPPFNNDEARQLLTSITGKPADIGKVPPRLLKELCCPFYMQLYYQLHEQDKDADYKEQLTYYELVAEFVLRKVYLSKRSTEKILLIHHFIKVARKNGWKNSVGKKHLLQEINQYLEAYEEMVNNGIWMEENHSDVLAHREVIRFVHSHIFEYFIAQQLIEEYEGAPQESLLQEVDRQFQDASLKMNLFQWILRYFIHEKRPEIIRLLLQIPLSPVEKNQVFLFVSSLLKHHRTSLAQEHYENGPASSYPVGAFLSMEFMGEEYEKALLTFLDFSDQPEEKINIYCILAIFSLLEMDREKLAFYFKSLRRFDEKVYQSAYPIHPLKSLKLIIDFYCNQLRSQPEFMDEINMLVSKAKPSKQALSNSQIISYRLAVMAYSLLASPDEVIKFILAIRERHPSVFLHRNDNGFSAFLLCQLGHAFARLRRPAEAARIHSFIKALAATHDGHYFTTYAQISVWMLEGNVLQLQREFQQSEDIFDKAYNLARKAGFSLLQAYAGALKVEAYKRQGNFEKVTCLLQDMSPLMKRKGFALEKLLLDRLAEVS